jgi:hypothetical protein
MIKCTLILTEWFTKKVSKKVITPSRPNVAADYHSYNNPNCIVTLNWEADGKQNSITLNPYNMRVDQLSVDECELSVNKFTNKWYGKVSKAKLREIEKELAEEFVEEEEPVDEEMVIEED